MPHATVWTPSASLFRIWRRPSTRVPPAQSERFIDGLPVAQRGIEVVGQRHRLQDGWTDGRDESVAHQIVDKIATLVTGREQRLLALPPAAPIRWTALARENQWNAMRRGALETTGGLLDVSLYYNWEPRIGRSASAHWGIQRTKAGGSPGQSRTSGRVPLGDVCCDQAVGDLEDWGWPRPESLSIGRTLAEKGLSDWMELEPERARRWQDAGL